MSGESWIWAIQLDLRWAVRATVAAYAALSKVPNNPDRQIGSRRDSNGREVPNC